MDVYSFAARLIRRLFKLALLKMRLLEKNRPCSLWVMKNAINNYI